MPFTIEELPIPATPGAAGWADFVAMADVRNAAESEAFGSTELSLSAEELLPEWLNQQYDPKRLFVARVDEAVVARATYETLQDPSAETAWLGVQVLPAFRRRGIGTALTDRLEAIAAAEGRRIRLVYAASAEGPGARIAAPTGFGSVPQDNEEVRFLLARGFRLEQVERGSRLALPADEALLARQHADAAAHTGGDYSVLCWVDRTPERWLDDMAVLFTRMSTDAPTAGLEEPEDVWTAERLAAEERSFASSPRTMLTAAALHRASGRLAAPARGEAQRRGVGSGPRLRERKGAELSARGHRRQEA